MARRDEGWRSWLCLRVRVVLFDVVTARGAVSSRGVLTLRGFRLLRIMSFLHLERSYQAMKDLREIFALKKQELGVVSYLTIVIVLTSSTTM